MHQIILKDLGRRFGVNWIFRNLNTEFSAQDPTVILGTNGSGKSTLLKTLSGSLSPTKGELNYQINGTEVNVDQIYKHIAICAPYLALPEELNLDELLRFHQKLKPMVKAYSAKEFASELHLEYYPDKPIHLYSSGMKQRVKLGLALFSQAEILLLDEPVSNLDEDGKNWYKSAIDKNRQERIVIVASNQIEDEYFFCTKQINILDYK